MYKSKPKKKVDREYGRMMKWDEQGGSKGFWDKPELNIWKTLGTIILSSIP